MEYNIAPKETENASENHFIHAKPHAWRTYPFVMQSYHHAPQAPLVTPFLT